MSTRTSRDFESQSVTTLQSELIFDDLAYWAMMQQSAEFTDKQRVALEIFHRVGHVQVRKGMTHQVITTGNRSVSKHMMITPQLPTSPVRESNLASEMMMQYLHALEIAQYLEAKQEKDLQALFLTFSFKNASFGHLADAEQLLKMLYKKLRRFMERTMDWKDAEYLGTLPTMEVTINRKHLLNGDKENLYHPHMHVTIFFTGDVNMGDASRQLWAKFKKLCDRANAKASSAAFKLERTYEKDVEADNSYFVNGEEQKGDNRKKKSMIDGILEATKYQSKPADLNMLKVFKKDPKDVKDFKVSVWAEIYQAAVHPQLSKNCPYKGLTKATLIRNGGSGIFLLATQIFKAIVNAGFGGLFDFQPANGDISKVPAVFVQMITVKIEKVLKMKKDRAIAKKRSSGYYIQSKIAKATAMNPEEVAYYNRLIMRSSLFEEGLDCFKKALSESHVDLSNKSSLIIDVMENFLQWNHSQEDIDAVIDDWIDTVIECTADDSGDYDELRVADIKALKDAYHLALNDENYKNVRTIYRRFMMDDFRQGEDNIELKENGHIAIDGYDFSVRNWKNLDLAKKLCQIAKNDPMVDTVYANGGLERLYHKVLTGEMNLRRLEKDDADFWTVETVRNYVAPYVALTANKKMTTDTKSRFAYPINTWNFWEGDSNAMESKLTGVTPQLQLLVACLLYAMAPDQWEEAVLCVGSAARTVNVTVDAEAVKRMTKRLLKKNSSNSNSLFKTFAKKLAENSEKVAA